MARPDVYWTGILQLSGHNMRRTGYTQALRDAGLRRLIIENPDNKLDGSWAPKWVCQLLEWAPTLVHRRGSAERAQARQRRDRWLRAVIPAVERDIGTHMAAVDAMRRLVGPLDPKRFDRAVTEKRFDVVQRWAEGVLADE